MTARLVPFPSLAMPILSSKGPPRSSRTIGLVAPRRRADERTRFHSLDLAQRVADAKDAAPNRTTRAVQPVARVVSAKHPE